MLLIVSLSKKYFWGAIHQDDELVRWKFESSFYALIHVADFSGAKIEKELGWYTRLHLNLHEVYSRLSQQQVFIGILSLNNINQIFYVNYLLYFDLIFLLFIHIFLIVENCI